ncbi:PREDICTED: serine/arginine-rich SC35-like splicing factor SCL28 isoform X2 [Erythranthe guttata]|uniref:serine/arginine-rich SC35-like splicing factor SCL28 isoform X2 n=1 Tax=Erythranthe guttata TaxID=4155 RepID=UPI00064E151E|nr:PREDICTED: serine/arginine-rich SC35-like splicing factor SCL28 isoform X2 [Erythranthe guttata]|eukprot:XP_012858568.1 PREDICTED: serine/arginine-rich SC35-like splicing factor SCL28 isoform X2 [Erythranthe guttata]
MANHRSRSSSRGRRRIRSRSRSPATRKEDKRGERRSPALSCLYVTNIPFSTSREEIRVHFEKFGPLEDVNLPNFFYSGKPRGFGFVKFLNPEDAAKAQKQLDHTVISGRVVTVTLTRINKKTPAEMRKLTGPRLYILFSLSFLGNYIVPRYIDLGYRALICSYRGSRWKRSPLSSPRQRYRSYLRSRSPARLDLRRHRSRERSRRHRKSSPHDEKSQKSNRGSPSSKEKVRTDYAPRRSPAKSRSRYYSRR